MKSIALPQLVLKLVKIHLRMAQIFKHSFQGQVWILFITLYWQMVLRGYSSTLWTLWKVEAALALNPNPQSQV